MHYKVTKFVGPAATQDGWTAEEGKNWAALKNGSGKIQIKIDEEKAFMETGDGNSILIVRDGKTARLMKNAEGKVKIGDKIWLLNKDAWEEYKSGVKNNFDNAALLLELHDGSLEKKQAIYVSERPFFQERNNKNINIILGGIVFTLLVTGIILGYQKKTTLEQTKKYNEIKSEVETKIAEIESVRSVNMETALQLAQGAEAIIDNAGIAQKKYVNELADLKKRVTEVKKELGGESIDYEVAYDATLIKEGNNEFKGMATKDAILFLWSANSGQINQVDPGLKSTEKIVSDERIKSWLGIFNNGEKWYGYSQNKIYEIKRNDLVETEIKGVLATGEMAGWNGLTYVIDNSSQNIIKLTNGEGKIWLKEGITLSEEMTSIAIDSNIWTLGKSGKIYQYNRGVDEKFVMSFLPTLTSAKNLRTSDKVNFLAYVADENTVVIYGKDGKILGKYNFGKIKINDIGVENQNKAVLVLAENGKIYRIKVK